MNFNNTVLQKILKSKTDDFKSAVLADKIIVETIIELLKYRESDFKFTDSKHPNWTVERAMRDGRLKEIQWWMKLLSDNPKQEK